MENPETQPTAAWRSRALAIALALLIAMALTGRFAPTQAKASGNQPGGVTLDLYGGLHAFGSSALNATGAPYWPRSDIARSLSVIEDGSGGWTLDAFGGIHQWGAAPAIATPSYWPGWDIARAVVVLPDEQSGYILDGFGGLHNFGTAPVLSGPYWGWDVARGFDVALDGSNHVLGGWVLDAWGGIHPVGTPPPLNSPATYEQGHNVWQSFHYTAQGAYSVGLFGLLNANYSGVSPDWAGYSDWGSTDIIRDTYLFNPSQSPAQPQPISADAMSAFHFMTVASGVIARPQCGVPISAMRAGQVILMSLVCQELSAYQDGNLVVDALITTGRPARPTPPGWTSVMSKNHPFHMVSGDPPSSPYYYYPSWVQYVTWFRSGGYGIHDAYWEADSALGPGSEYNESIASHGCVHVTLGVAQFIYSWANIGTPVGIF